MKIEDVTLEENHPAEERHSKPAGFFARHKRLFLCVGIALLVCAIIAAAVIISISVKNTQQAREMAAAQVGRCYIVQRDNTTSLYYFQAAGYSHVYIHYDDWSKEIVDEITGSLSEIDGDYAFKISLDGKVTLNTSPFQLRFYENYQIIQEGSDRWTVISLEEAQKLEAKARSQAKLYDSCGKKCKSAIGPEGFLERLTSKINEKEDLNPKKASNDEYINAAKSLLSNYLKNPSTAVYNSASVVETDNYGRAIVYLDVSAQNSFGGYVRSTYYICIQGIYGNQYRYNSYAYSVESKSQLSYLKSANDWNEDRNKSHDTTRFIPKSDGTKSTVVINEMTLDRYEYTATDATYVVYVEPESQYVVAAQIMISKNRIAIMDSEMLDKAICGTMQATHELWSVEYEKVFSIEDGIVSRKPHWVAECNCMYYATEKAGNYQLFVINAKLFGDAYLEFWTVDE